MTHPDLLRLARSCAKWRNGVLLVATLSLISVCQQARATDRLDVVVIDLLAPGDTAVYGVSWTAGPVTPSRPAATVWHIRLVGADTSKDTFGEFRAPLVLHQLAPARTRDTVRVALPLNLTDSVGPLRVAVRGANQFGPGAWFVTSPWYAKRRGQTPSAPTVTVDTIPELAAIFLRPSVVALTPGARVQLCTIWELRDGRSGIISTGIKGADTARRLDTLAECQRQYALWLNERQL